MNIVNVEKFEVLPSNQPADNTYSFRNGNPIITISVPAQSKLLRASSVRINGTLRINTSAGVLPDNNNLKGGGATAIELSSRVGIHSAFQNVVLSSEVSNQSLEAIRQYGRLVASLLSSTHSAQDLATEKTNVALLTGLEGSSHNLVNNEVRFSIPLYCGMLMGGQAIPLSQNGVNGLKVQLELASDNQVLKGVNAGDAGGAFYEIKDVSLTGDLLIPDDKGVAQLSVAGAGAFQYNSWSSLYSVINSSDTTQTYNLANSQVLSVIHNFAPVSNNNNYSQDGFANGMLLNTDAGGNTYNEPVVLKKVSFSRGGVKLGMDYEMDCEEQSTNGLPETQVMMSYLNAFQPLNNNSRMLNQKQLLGYGANDVLPFYPLGERDNASSGKQADANRNFGIGLAMDRVSDVGINFKGQSYATRIQSTLDGKSPNSVYTFILAKNTLQYSPQGIMVMN
jgi:hypothetical protein